MAATNTTEVIIFCDQCDATVTQKAAEGQKAYTTTVVPLVNGPEMAKAIRLALCSRRAKAQHAAGSVANASSTAICCVNWCAGDEESTDRADAAKVAQLLEGTHKAPLVGNPASIARYDTEDIRMLMFYSDLPCPNFCIVKEAKDMVHLSGIKCPADVTVGKAVSKVTSTAILESTVATALETQPVVLVTESSTAATHTMTLIINDGAIYNKVALTPIARGEAAVAEPTEKAVTAFAETVASTIMGKQGHAKVSVHVCAKGELTLAGVVFNMPTPIAEAGITMQQYLSTEVPAALSKAVAAAPRHIVSFDPVGKGYFMRAAKNIKKGELVFEDERRAFAIVTREHVAKTWSDADKYTFSRYAWPLDSDCHVYAIWEDDPKRWRPINHSCDPNLVFAEGHSLNVIARRDIAEREDLTLDYSTFCDYTMKPFECFCKTSLCRGTVTPGQVPWEQYGTNSWFRREPPQVTDLVPKDMQQK